MKRIKSVLKAISNFFYKDEGIDYEGYIAYDKGIPSLRYKVGCKFRLLWMTFIDTIEDCKDMMEVNEVMPKLKQFYEEFMKQYKELKYDRHQITEAK